MLAPDDSNVTRVVVEMKPGWIDVMVEEPRAEPGRTERLLRRTIEHWFSVHPLLVIDRVQTLTENGTLHGMRVWYHEAEDRETAVDRANRPVPLTFQVNEELTARLQPEYLEAVFKETELASGSLANPLKTHVLINRRKIAVVLDLESHRCALEPLEVVFPGLDTLAKVSVRKWQKAPQGRFLVIELAGSWFQPRTCEAIGVRPADAPFVRTNLTYDTGPRPDAPGREDEKKPEPW